MPFSSITFIFLFLPITLILYYVFPRKGWRRVVLSLTSLFFSYGLPPYEISAVNIQKVST
jgi:alginate O-acetyltransferase complex protein AlgI